MNYYLASLAAFAIIALILWCAKSGKKNQEGSSVIVNREPLMTTRRGFAHSAYMSPELPGTRRPSNTSTNRSDPRNRVQVQRSSTADSMTFLSEPPPLYNGTALLPGEGAIIVEIPAVNQSGASGDVSLPDVPPPSYSRSRTNVARSSPLAAIIEMEPGSAVPEPPAYPELSRGADTPQSSQTIPRN